MLNENLKQLRKSKGLTQEEFALQLNVVRQTVSKWEKGISVPDSEMLINISQQFGVKVSTLLGEDIDNTDTENMIKTLTDKLTIINDEKKQNDNKRRKVIRAISCGGLAVVICYLVWQIIIMINTNSSAFMKNNESTSIIGGADGPTSIFVYSTGLNVMSIVVIVAILILSVCGFYFTRKK